MRAYRLWDLRSIVVSAYGWVPPLAGKITVPNSEEFKPSLRAVEEDGRLRPERTIHRNINVLGDPDAERCLAFRSDFPTLDAAKTDPLYVLPRPLVAAVCKALPKWLTREEVKFEHALEDFCQSVGAIGIAEESFVSSNLLSSAMDSRSATTDVADGDAARCGTSGGIEAAMQKMEEMHDLLRPYMGWLMTNRAFLGQRDRIRDRRLKRGWRQSFSLFFDGGKDGAFRTFLRKWMLTEMRSWEVPVPQGPNLSGAKWPAAAIDLPGRVNISVPVTIALPSKYPIQETMTDARRLNTPRHLRSWQRILDRKAGGRGLGHFGQLYPLHFYLNVAMQSRYGSRMAGNMGKLDLAFADFLCLGEDRIKQLRKHAAQRLAGR
jgi:hypothetical protein